MSLFHLTFATYALPPAMFWTAWLWIFILAGCIGSFLNVVVYRLPRGKSVVHPGSACPACGKAIRWQHNIPVLAWFMLKGKCHDCGSPISSRYPAIEAVVAVVLSLLAVAGPLSGGWNLPGTIHEIEGWAGPLEWASLQHLSLLFAHHSLLFCSLLALALIAYDSTSAEPLRPPLWLVGTALAMGCLAAACWPLLHPVPMSPTPVDRLAGQGAWQGLTGALTSGLVGLFAGLLAWPVLGNKPGVRAASLACAVLVGTFLGWQASYLLVAVTTLLYLPARRVFPGSNWPLLLTTATAVWLIFWQAIYNQFSWAGSAGPREQTIALGVVSLVTVVAAWMQRRWIED